jgi:hypothetical protein
MAKATRVFSTPRTSTPISQNSLVDPTRRHLLTVAAGGAVAAAIATTVPTISPATATPVDPSTAPHPDAKLLELGLEYERLWAIEEPLGEESERLWNVADRVRYEKLGVDPDDKEACRAALDNRHSEWNAVREIADEEVGYNKAWHRMNRASLKTERIGRKILKIAPNTMAGFIGQDPGDRDARGRDSRLRACRTTPGRNQGLRKARRGTG